MPFTGDSDVAVKQTGDINWELLARLRYKGKFEPFSVPVGMDTDFASVPRIFVWFLPRYGRYTKAAILHDYLWRHKAVNDEISWVDADAIFRRSMRELDVAFLRRWMMWAAVRWGALTKKRGRKGWWKESWRVLLFTLLALPIVLPPAILILVALVLFFALELLFWAPIKATSLVRDRVGTPSGKKVVMPGVRLKT
jgi:uncharacterized protein DUF1353